MKHGLDAVGLHIHLQRLRRLVGNNAVGIAVLHEVLELAIGSLPRGDFLFTLNVGRAVGEIEKGQCGNGYQIHPVHIELGHLGLVVLILFHIIF